MLTGALLVCAQQILCGTDHSFSCWHRGCQGTGNGAFGQCNLPTTYFVGGLAPKGRYGKGAVVHDCPNGADNCLSAVVLTR